jgi:hypothetical protein
MANSNDGASEYFPFSKWNDEAVAYNAAGRKGTRRLVSGKKCGRRWES